MTEQREYRVSIAWTDGLLAFITKMLWFGIAVILIAGLGMWLTQFIPYPAWVPSGIQNDGLSTLMITGYLVWRLNGGAIKVRGDELVIRWRGSEKK